jgi:glucose-6-phosphate isomerase
MKKINPTKTAEWKQLNEHYEQMKNVHMRDLFARDNSRFDKFTIQFDHLLLDYSKNIITDQTMRLLLNLAKAVDLKSAIESMFAGEIINETEKRSVLHTALRAPFDAEIIIDGKNIIPDIHAVLDQMKTFSAKIRSGEWKGYTGKPITDIVNIGIGGSDLGPLMVAEALKFYKKKDLNIYFISNIDGMNMTDVLNQINHETCLFMIASKSFSTHETITNALTAREWFLNKAMDKKNIAKHFIAISSNDTKVRAFGIDAQNVFKFWDFVGGRYSIWSAIGLPIMCCIGYDNFAKFLKGAYEMDVHFRSAPFDQNIPIILALLGIWYNNFFDAETEAIFPYSYDLHRFPAYLQQAHMESNGKFIDRTGNQVSYQTCPIIWGEPGTNGQHAFFQLVHQGTKLIPSTFLASAIALNELGNHQNILVSNFLSQTESLMKGKTENEVRYEFQNQNINDDIEKTIIPYKIFQGNKPSNSILYKKLNPKTLGQLIAMFEHKIFVQGIIWNIFSFDQWGVELGKELAQKILKELDQKENNLNHDSSTNGLIKAYLKMRSNNS